MKVFSIFLLCTLLHLQYAFHVEIPNHKGNRLISKVRLSLLDPFTIGVATAAVASGFAAGTVIQAPKLEELESVKIVLAKELEAFKSNTTTVSEFASSTDVFMLSPFIFIFHHYQLFVEFNSSPVGR